MFKRKNKNNNINWINDFHKKEFIYVTCRSAADYSESVIGRQGVVNIVNDEMVLMCENKEIFRAPLHQLEVATLMSLDGFTIKQPYHPERGTIVVYYKYHRK